MATELYLIKVLKVQPKKHIVKFKIKEAYVEEFSATPYLNSSFFLRVLYESLETAFYDELITEQQKKTSYLFQLLDKDEEDIFDENWVDLNAYKAIEKVKKVYARFAMPITRFKWIHLFYFGLNKLIAPRAVYQVKVKENVDLTHLKPGMKWESTAYVTNPFSFDETEVDRLPQVLKPHSTYPLNKQDYEAFYVVKHRMLLLLSNSGEFSAYTTPTFQEVWRYQIHHQFSKLKYDPSTDLVWLYQKEEVYQTLNMLSGQPTTLKPLPKADLISSLGNHRVKFEYQNKVSFLDTQGNELWKIKHWEHFWEVGFSADEQYLAIHKHETCQVEIWDVQQRKRVKRLKNLLFVEAANFSFDPTNTLLALVIDYNTLGVFEISTNKALLIYPFGEEELKTVFWSSDGLQMMVCLENSDTKKSRVEVFKMGLKF